MKGIANIRMPSFTVLVSQLVSSGSTVIIESTKCPDNIARRNGDVPTMKHDAHSGQVRPGGVCEEADEAAVAVSREAVTTSKRRRPPTGLALASSCVFLLVLCT